MKTFEQYIRESVDFRLGGSAKKGGQRYNYFPKDDEELMSIMETLRKERGGDGDFNDIDTSNITVMSDLFEYQTTFNGDISGWDTSKVTDMYQMFYHAESFNQDISCWNTSSVTSSPLMFDRCPIKEEYKPKFNI